MRAKEVVPRLCGLGAFVHYTHRASSVTGDYALRDVGRYEQQRIKRLLGGEVLRGVLAARAYQEIRLRRPRRSQVLLNRWVAVWPEAGYGTVTGLTLRSEGVVQHGDDGAGWLREVERWPLYEVRTSLTGLRMLVPVWACVPVPPGSGVWLDHTPHVTPSMGGHASWDAYVAHWLRPRRGQVASVRG